MIQLLSLLFLLQIIGPFIGPCNSILSCDHSYTPISDFNNFRISDEPSKPGTRYLNPVQQDRWLEAVEKKLFYGTLTEGFVKENKVDVTKPQMIVYGGRCDGTRHTYLIEHVIDQRYPVSSFEILLKTGTPVDGMNDYSPIAHILQDIVKQCGTKTRFEDAGQTPQRRKEWQTDADRKLALYQNYLNILFKYNVDLKKEFPVQDKHSDISSENLFGEEPVNALNFLQKAREIKKKNENLIVFDAPIATIQTMLEQEAERRKQPVLNPTNSPIPAEIKQSTWFQSTLFKTAVGVGILTAFFFATKWLYPKSMDSVHLPKR